MRYYCPYCGSRVIRFSDCDPWHCPRCGDIIAEPDRINPAAATLMLLGIVGFILCIILAILTNHEADRDSSLPPSFSRSRSASSSQENPVSK